jgi:hypothetical protein
MNKIIAAFLSIIPLVAQRPDGGFALSHAPGGNPIVGPTINLGDNLQTLVNNAKPGDTLVLPAGYVWIGNLVLPVKPPAYDASGNPLWITIKSTLSLPNGQRVKPGEPKATIISPTSDPAISNDFANPDFTKTAAHHYRFDGINVLVSVDCSLTWNLISLAAPQSATPASLAHDIEFHHMYVHGTDDVMNPDGSYKNRYEMIRGMMLDAANVTVADSYVDNFRSTFQEANAIGTITSPGPFTFSNNFLEGAGENILFCGALPQIPGMDPAGIKITGNYFYKRPAWQTANPHVVIKNLLEFKDARGVTVDGNVFENIWLGDQNGYAIVFTPRTGGYHLTASIQDVLFQNNIIRHAVGGILMGAYDDTASMNAGYTIPLSALNKSNHLTITNNLFDDISGLKWGTNRGIGFGIIGPPDNLTISKNTVNFAETLYVNGVGPDNDAGWWLNIPWGNPVNMVVEDNMFGWQLYGDGLIGPDAVYNAVFNRNTVENVEPWRVPAWQSSIFAARGNIFDQPAPSISGASVPSLLTGEAAIKSGNR